MAEPVRAADRTIGETSSALGFVSNGDTALRVLMWDVGAKSNEKERLARLESHRDIEQNETGREADQAPRRDATAG